MNDGIFDRPPWDARAPDAASEALTWSDVADAIWLAGRQAAAGTATATPRPEPDPQLGEPPPSDVRDEPPLAPAAEDT
ncbi:hypothetical protein, partial [Actinoallomurus acaciae]